MSSEEKKIKWRPNLFDIVIILIGIAVMAVIVLVMRPAATNVNQNTALEYTIELQGMPEGASRNIQVGDEITDNVRHQLLGTVVSVTTVPYTTNTSTADGLHTYQKAIEGFETAHVVLRSNMSITDSEIITEGGFTIRVGAAVAAKGPCYACNGFVIAIERGEE